MPPRSTVGDENYERLRRELQDAREASALPERPLGKAALDDLLVRLRLGSLPTHGATSVSGQPELPPDRPFQRGHVARRD